MRWMVIAVAIDKSNLEEALLKFFYGECSPEELSEVQEELCTNEECHKYLEKVSELLRLLRSSSEESETPVDWDEVKERYNRLVEIVARANVTWKTRT